MSTVMERCDKTSIFMEQKGKISTVVEHASDIDCHYDQSSGHRNNKEATVQRWLGQQATQTNVELTTSVIDVTICQ